MWFYLKALIGLHLQTETALSSQAENSSPYFGGGGHSHLAGSVVASLLAFESNEK